MATSTPVNSISPKVTAATASGAAAGAVVTILVWIAAQCGIAVPVEVATAATVLISAAAAWLGGWIKTDPARRTGQHVADD